MEIRIMAARVITIIKPYQSTIGAAASTPEPHQPTETEVREKRVLIVKNWISERRDNDTQERSESRREVIEWRELSAAPSDKKIAIRALTE